MKLHVYHLGTRLHVLFLYATDEPAPPTSANEVISGTDSEPEVRVS